MDKFLLNDTVFIVSLFYVYDANTEKKENIIVELATLKKLFQIAYSWPHDELYIACFYSI